MSKSINLTSKEWRDLIFDGKNKEFGAYNLREKSNKRHVTAIIWVIIGIIVLGFLIWGYVAYQNKIAEEEALAKAAEMQALLEQQMEEVEEEQPEEEEEIAPPPPPPEEQAPEPPPEAAQMVTTIAIEDVPDKEKEVITQIDIKENDAQINSFKQEGEVKLTTEVQQVKVEEINTAVQAVVAPPPPPPAEEKVKEPEPVVEKKPEPEKVFDAVEQSAEFPGGQAAMMKWLGNNIRYPELAQQNNIEGKVIVQFVVEKDGSISGVTVAKGVDKDLDKEATRVVSKMPKWKPGKNNGVAVRQKYTLPVVFKLQQ